MWYNVTYARKLGLYQPSLYTFCRCPLVRKILSCSQFTGEPPPSLPHLARFVCAGLQSSTFGCEPYPALFEWAVSTGQPTSGGGGSGELSPGTIPAASNNGLGKTEQVPCGFRNIFPPQHACFFFLFSFFSPFPTVGRGLRIIIFIFFKKKGARRTLV